MELSYSVCFLLVSVDVSITSSLFNSALVYYFLFMKTSIINFLINYLMGVVADACVLASAFRCCGSILYAMAAVAVQLGRRSVLRRSGLKTREGEGV